MENLSRREMLKLQREKKRLLEELSGLSLMIKGSYFERYSTCVRPNCSCHRGERHGPRGYVVTKGGEKPQSQHYVPKGQVQVVESGIEQYRRMLKIAGRITAINLRLMRVGGNWEMDPEDILEQLAGHVDLGHAKRDASFLRQVALAVKSPGAPATQGAGGASGGESGSGSVPMSDLMSLYRFAGNPNVELSDLRKIRADSLLEWVSPGSDLLIIHDVTLLDYSRHSSKKDRRSIGNHKGKGYEYTACLAFDPRSETILGLLHDTVTSESGPDDQEMMDYDYEPLFQGFSEEERKKLTENHRHQMAVHINGLAPRLAEYNTVHVADREFDDVFILDRIAKTGGDWVIRGRPKRNVGVPDYRWLKRGARAEERPGNSLPEGFICADMSRVVEQVPLKPYKKLPLDARGRVTDPKSAKRVASLKIGAFRACLYKRAMRNGAFFVPPRVEVNVVVIREENPPEGEKPLFWVLVTSLPVDIREQMAQVGYLYECRWKIEEFFRLLKSGYGIERYRMNNSEKIARMLVILSIAAMAVLTLKRDLGLPSRGTLDDGQYQMIKKAMLEPDNTEIDLELRLFAYAARMGGWLGRRRDPIGPTVLMRGLLQVLAIIDAHVTYRGLIEEVLENPDAIRRFRGMFCV